MILSSYAFKKRLEMIIPFLKKTDKILDFGAGKGNLANELLVKGFSVKTLDINKDFFPDIVADGENTGLPSNSFDVVIAVEVLEHGNFIPEITRILKPNGLLIGTIPDPDYEKALDVLISFGLIKSKETPHVNLKLPMEHITEELALIDSKKVFGGMSHFFIYKKMVNNHE